MCKLFSFINAYKNLEKPVLNVIFSEFIYSNGNGHFYDYFAILSDIEGFSDEEITLFIAGRSLVVFMRAFSLGPLIEGILNLFENIQQYKN